MELNEFSSLLSSVFEKYKVKNELSSEQVEIFYKMTMRLLSENEKYNLTAIRTVDGVVENHIFDSILPAALIPQNASVLDVGSGGGFPSLPLAVVRPDITVTALDSTEKKVEYIKETADFLGLSNVKTICGRAEELSLPFIDKEKAKKTGQKPSPENFFTLRESFDVVIARSVAGLNVLSELCVPFLAVGGKFIAMKSEKALHEVAEAQNALFLLGCVQKCEVIKPYSISPESDKLFAVTSKRSATPIKYPRKYAQIKKKPL